MHKSKAALFLMELLLTLLFFSIAGAVCLQLFGYAHLTNKASHSKSDANMIFSDLADDFFGNEDIAEGNETFFYNSSLERLSQGNGTYTATVTTTFDSGYFYCNICICDSSSDEIYLDKKLKKYERSTPLNE